MQSFVRKAVQSLAFLAGLFIVTLLMSSLSTLISSAAEPPAPTTTDGVQSSFDTAIGKTSVLPDDPFDRMSPMGLLAHRAIEQGAGGAGVMSDDPCLGEECESEPAGGQAETSIAVDATGQHIVIGFNDTRGWKYSVSPTSVSGVMYSDDGGLTFHDGGLLTTTAPLWSGTANGTSPAGAVPQVRGDPEVKYIPGGAGGQFVYFSIGIIGYGTGPNYSAAAQTLVFHRSTDFGHTWTGPYVIPAATNPNGLLDGFGSPRDAADKEFADVDPDTGRVLVSWSDFTPTTVHPGGVQISSVYCNNIMTGNPPTWSTRSVLNGYSNTFDTGSIPRFAGNGSNNVYLSWSTQITNAFSNNVMVATSPLNGTSWSVIQAFPSNFRSMDYVLGNDRVHSFPSLAVDNSNGPYKNTVYLVVANNGNKDGSDISLLRSTNGGQSFSAPILLNSHPGNDRAQWFPWVTVDKNTGRVYVFYLDQGVATSGDLTEVSYTYSDDGGTHWSKPAPLTSQPFRAGYGNDTGQPNIGDYNQAVAQNGELFAVWGGTFPVGFADGAPEVSMNTPDPFFRRLSASTVIAPLHFGNITFQDTAGNRNGFIDPGERITFTIPLVNYITNTLNLGDVTGINANLTVDSPGATVIQGNSTYPTIGPGATALNNAPYVVQFAPGFTPGTTVSLTLTLSSAQGSNVLSYLQDTGTPSSTTIFSENFDGATVPSLPSGWSNWSGAWTTNNTFCGTSSKGLYHSDSSGYLTAVVQSPNITIPSDSEYVTLDFDICYNLEDDRANGFNVLAYDGVDLTFQDLTHNRFSDYTYRFTLAEAFAEQFTTGSVLHYPKHLPRNGNYSYNEDMSVWSGDSDGFKHVRMKLPGMQGSTVKLTPEYTQDFADVCLDGGANCGVIIDNIVMKSVKSVSPADLAVTVSAPAMILPGRNLAYTIEVSNNGPAAAANAHLSDNIPAGTAFQSLSAPAGWVCTTPAVGGTGTIGGTKTSLAAGETDTFVLVVKVDDSVPFGSTISNTAQASTSTLDAVIVNNLSTAATTVGFYDSYLPVILKSATE